MSKGNPYKDVETLPRWKWLWNTNKGVLFTMLGIAVALGLFFWVTGATFIEGVGGLITLVIVETFFVIMLLRIHKTNLKGSKNWEELYGSTQGKK